MLSLVVAIAIAIPMVNTVFGASNFPLAFSTAGGDTTCGNWTKSGEGNAMLGHADRMGLRRSMLVGLSLVSLASDATSRLYCADCFGSRLAARWAAARVAARQADNRTCTKSASLAGRMKDISERTWNTRLT